MDVRVDHDPEEEEGITADLLMSRAKTDPGTCPPY